MKQDFSYGPILSKVKKHLAKGYAVGGVVTAEEEGRQRGIGSRGLIKRPNVMDSPEPRRDFLSSFLEGQDQKFKKMKEIKLAGNFPFSGVNLSGGFEGISETQVKEISPTVTNIVRALSMTESSGGTNLKHPLVKKGQYKGQRAIGEYAIMPGNVKSWTKEALGYEMSIEDFKDNPAAQAYVTEYKIEEFYKKYGTVEDAASVWFTGQPVKKAGNVNDGYISAPEYLQKFMNNYLDTKSEIPKVAGGK